MSYDKQTLEFEITNPKLMKALALENEVGFNLDQSIYRPIDSDEFPIGKYIFDKTGRVVSKYVRIDDMFYVDQSKTLKVLEEINAIEIFRKGWIGIELYSSMVYYDITTDSGVTIVSVSNVLGADIPLSINKPRKDGSDSGVILAIISNDTTEKFEEILKKLAADAPIRKIERNQVHLVISSRNGYDTTSFDLPTQKLNLELNYGKGFKPVHDKILKELNKPNGKGLVLLHGTPGTGKTHYLKYLASKIKNKKVLFIPPYLADFITSPEMTPFLIENSNSILFIEDAEKVITDRNIEGSRGVSNILNLTDGILSDILNIQIVATFNMDKRKIDTALLRKGRLIAEHRFDKLSLEETQKLADHFKYNIAIKEGMTLTDVYNMNESEFKSEGEYMQKIGFGV
jgi:hypothetical protein